MSPISPSKSNGQNSPHSGNNTGSSNNSPRHPQSSQHLVSLQAKDFPPLTTGVAVQEKRVPFATGAWAAASKPVLSPNLNGNPNAPQSVRGEEPGNQNRTGCRVSLFFLFNVINNLFFSARRTLHPKTYQTAGTFPGKHYQQQ
jgi:hypothetical protein